MSKNFIAIVPARAGSKGVPGKNKKLILGKPMIDFTVEVLRQSSYIDSIIVTTDDRDILKFYESRDDLFLVNRPDSLSNDLAETKDVVIHAMDAFVSVKNYFPGNIILAQPTTPLRSLVDLNSSIELFLNEKAESLISVCKAEGIRHPKVLYSKSELPHRGALTFKQLNSSSRRQDDAVYYQRNGAIYIVKTDFFLHSKRLMSEEPVLFEMPWERSINIDSPGDMIIAEAMLKNGALNF